MNRDVVEAIYQEILKEKIVMEYWLSIPGYDLPEEYRRAGSHPEIALNPVCGTVGCIAGTACLLFPERMNLKEPYLYYIAAEIIGISSEIADILFFASEWPLQYQQMPQKLALKKIFERALEENSFTFLLTMFED